MKKYMRKLMTHVSIWYVKNPYRSLVMFNYTIQNIYRAATPKSWLLIGCPEMTMGELHSTSLQWRHNERDSVFKSPASRLFINRLFRRRSKKTPKLRVTGLCEENSLGTGEFPHKGPVTRKMFPFDDVIILCTAHTLLATSKGYLLGLNY